MNYCKFNRSNFESENKCLNILLTFIFEECSSSVLATFNIGSCPRVTENSDQKNLSAFASNAAIVLVFSDLINNSWT